MSQFKDTYGILALAATTKKTPHKEDTDKPGNFFGELEKILDTVNSKLIGREQYRVELHMGSKNILGATNPT